MSDTKRLPKTVDEAVDWLIEELDEDALIKVRDSENLGRFHMGLGMYIRNQLVYQNEYQKELLEDVFSRVDIPDDKSDIRYYLYRHVDNVSDVILQELQKRLREEDKRI